MVLSAEQEIAFERARAEIFRHRETVNVHAIEDKARPRA